MKKWFMENGFANMNKTLVKPVVITDEGLMFWVEYDEYDNSLTIMKMFKNYDICY